jgi:glycosyltransferase involved in cell wall biosynthesis
LSSIISVITIFLNAERFLEETVDSVLGQAFQQWELLLVDDGSTDASSAIARRLADQHSGKVHYLEHDGHKNLGMSASRNFGIQHAKGPYVALLDADDAWYPDKLKEQLDILERNPQVEMVYGNHLFWKSWTGKPEDVDVLMDLNSGADRVFYPPELLNIYFQSSKVASPVPSDLFFRRDLALRRPFDNSFRNMYEDQVFLIQVFAHENVYVSTKTWTRYRQHTESFVSRFRSSTMSKGGAPPALNWAEKYLSDQGFKGTVPWKALQRVLFRFKHPALFRVILKVKSILYRILHPQVVK